MTSRLRRPNLVLSEPTQRVTRATSFRKAAVALRDGQSLLVEDHYRTGAEILEALQLLMPTPSHDAPFEQRREQGRSYREASLRLLAPIRNHRVTLTDAGDIGFLRELYPNQRTFFLPFVTVQELHGAWERYSTGVYLPVLGQSVHPFYGTYVPTRMVHLELFGTWLRQFEGARDRAIDVGTGCGVLALMLAKAGFHRVLATDTNPNAVESVQRELQQLHPTPSIDVTHTDLLGSGTKQVDLVVFNPPWIPGEAKELLDQALYFEDNLIERFFEQAAERITPDGRIVVVFSNLIQLIRPDVEHPVLAELERGRLRLVQKMQRKVKPSPNKAGPRRKTREKVEVWELARA